MVGAIVRVSDAKDSYTHGHSSMNAGLECNVGGAEIEAEKRLMGVNTSTSRAAAGIAPSK